MHCGVNRLAVAAPAGYRTKWKRKNLPARRADHLREEDHRKRTNKTNELIQRLLHCVMLATPHIVTAMFF
jgi:hypothetical protein